MRSQQHYDYYEAVIQLRPFNQEVIRFIQNQIKKRSNVRISKIQHLKKGDGINLYLTDQRFARSLGKKLSKSFKGKLTISRTLHSINRETSKKQYRVTVCFRLTQEQ